MSATDRWDRVRVYRASADKLLATLPDHSIDVIVTDPPYLTVNRRAESGHLRDWFADGLSWPQVGRVLVIGRRKLKPSGLLFLMTNGDGLADAHAALTQAGFIGIRTITWDRRWPGLGGGLRHRTEFILLGRLPGSRPISGSDLVAVSAVGPGTANRYPTEKPEGLGRAIARIAGIGPGDLVVDPFCGSGSLLVGPAQRGATVVGCDVAPRAVRLATARLRGTGPAGQGGPARGSGRVAKDPTRIAPRRSSGPKPPSTGSKRTRSGPSGPRSTDRSAPVSRPTTASRGSTGSARRSTGLDRTSSRPAKPSRRTGTNR